MKILVTGLGRSGTSLMMRMLLHGGVQVYCDGDFVTFETAKSIQLPKNTAWLKDVTGAVKIIDPYRHTPPPGDYKIIWLTRDFGEQAKSFAKLQRKQGKPATRRHAQWYKKEFRKVTQRNIRMMAKWGNPLLRVKFEELLTDPHGEANRIANFLAPEFEVDPAKMAAVVVKRSPKNYDGFLESKISTQKSIFSD
ncbi:sulfotransferase [Ekhidna sp.]|jgi:hypothetical protein|uniref:sulfotransferase family protein n=1 Tax=Ekhidna sp. TaxID=2608089 RepID=UPI0032EEB3DC